MIVRRVLGVILLLDQAKDATLLRSDPCLFRPSSTVKSSREMALEFSRAFLSGGVGDVNKHLSTLGVVLRHKQTALHEYNFAVERLSTDLRDGVRLCRLVDLTAGGMHMHMHMRLVDLTAGGMQADQADTEPPLTGATRVPANSRLQKVRRRARRAHSA